VIRSLRLFTVAVLLLAAVPAAAEPARVEASDWPSLLEQAETATLAGRYVQADAMLGWLEQNGPQELKGTLAISRAEFHLAKGNLEQAKSAFARADPNAGGVCRRSRVTGWIAGKSGEWNKAILRLSSAIENCGEDPSLWNLLGLALVGKGEFVAALEAFDSALMLEPRNAALFNNRALALIAAGRQEAAMDDLRQAANLQPENAAIAANVDYLSGRMGIEPVRSAKDSDTDWATRLARTGDGASDAARGGDATAYFANAALLLDRFDPRIWSLGALAQNRKEP
jgi:tetratricopeptide (TPR) repeat protein